jgi:MATE family multidrug resistance protein
MSERIKAEWRALTAIAVPVVIVEIGMMLMATVDTVLIGHYSPSAVAAVALGHLYFFNLIVFALGTLMALDPLVSQAVGANDEVAKRRAIQRAALLAVVFGVVVSLGALPAEGLLRLFRQPASVIPVTASYVHISAAAVPAFLMFTVVRVTLQAMHRVAPIVIAIVAANLINLVLNWMLIYGRWGAPELGVEGSAIATVIARWAMFFVLLALAWKELRPYLTVIDPVSFTARPIGRMLALGIPIGFQMQLEFGAFATVGLLMGAFGAMQVASHQIALNLAALTFMVPMGISAAGAVRVGHAIGAGDQRRARLAARLSYILAAAFMTTTALLFLLLPEQLASLYTNDSALVALTASLIPIAGMFQVFDGLQVVGAGVLRGLGDTRVPLFAMLSAYWVLGVPTSLLLAYRTGLGPQGLWWGFVVGLGSVSLFLLWRVVVLVRRGVGRVHIDAPSPQPSAAPVSEPIA